MGIKKSGVGRGPGLRKKRRRRREDGGVDLKILGKNDRSAPLYPLFLHTSGVTSHATDELRGRRRTKNGGG